jgi:2-oxoglutarate dehydrogenase E2 component (dihydrolipoamide succinyltransferase)
MATDVVMPQMGESIAEGTITKWLKQVGDRVERDEPLFEISTDKVDAEIPSPAAGVLTEIKFKEGETVEVNKVIAVLDGGAPSAEAAAPVADAPVAQSQAPEPATAEAAPPAVEAPPPTQPEPETPSATPAAPPVEAATPAPAPKPQPAQASPKPPEASPAPPQAQPTPSRGTSTVEDLRRTKSSPLVRKIATEHGINIAQLEGTGMSGRVTKNDILSYIESGAPVATPPPPAPATARPATPPAAQPPRAAPVAQPPAATSPATPPLRPAEGDRVERLSVMRKKIAEHMVLSRRTSAHVTTVYEIDMTKIARLRDQHKAEFLDRTGTKLTYMPFIFQAVTTGIRKFPIFNSQLTGDQIIYKRDINLGMAVALDWGLIVPVIKHADDLSISGLARAANDLADRARTKQLKPDEVGGGTFTITNPGVFGGLFGTPIINQPQVAILGVGKIEKRAKVMTTAEGEDYIAARWMAYFALSFDHRIIDGADAERFLAFVKSLLEEAEFSI